MWTERTRRLIALGCAASAGVLSFTCGGEVRTETRRHAHPPGDAQAELRPRARDSGHDASTADAGAPPRAVDAVALPPVADALRASGADGSRLPDAGAARDADSPVPHPGDAAIPLADLEGVYDLHFGPSGALSSVDCPTLWPQTRTRLLVGALRCSPSDSACPRTGLERASILGGHFDAAGVTRNAERVEFLDFERRYGHAGSFEVITALRLETGSSGFTGVGMATVQRQCPEGGQDEYDIAVSIGPDETAPLLAPAPHPAFAPFGVSWGEFRIDAPELVDVSLYSEDLRVAFGLRAVGGGPDPVLAASPANWVALFFEDPSSVAGSSLELFLEAPLFDSVGNPAVADSTPIPIARDAFIDGVLDFDDFPPGEAPQGMVGRVTYHSPEDGSPLCESGGCVEIGPLVPCHQHDGPTFFSIRFNASRHVNIALRASVQTSSASRGSMVASYVDDLQYIESGFKHPQLQPDTSGDALGYSTSFFDTRFPTQAQQARGGAFVLGCDGTATHDQMRLILERIEIVPDAAD